MAQTIVVGASILEKDNRFLLVQEKLGKARGKWNLPAGRLEIGEDIITCARREGEEETGFVLKPDYLVGVYEYSSASVNAIVFVFKQVILGGKLAIPDEEIMSAKWFSFDEINGLDNNGLVRASYVLLAIKDYLAGKKIPLDSIVTMDSP